MSARPLIFIIAIVLVLYLSANNFEVGALDITLIVAVAAIAIGIWFFAKGLGGGDK